MNEEKEIQGFKNSNLFQEIKTQIKDFVINRLINKICIQEKKLEIFKKENVILKNNLLYIIKKVLLQQSNEKNFLQSSKLNLKTITINKRSLNNSYFSPIKLTETISDSQSDFNTLNKSRLTRTGSLENKTNEIFKNLTIINNNQGKFLLTKNYSITDKLFLSEKKHKKFSSCNKNNFLLTEPNLINNNKKNKNNQITTYFSQRDVTIKNVKKKVLVNNNNGTPKKIIQLKKKNKNDNIENKKSLDGQKNDKKQKNRTPFLKNKA